MQQKHIFFSEYNKKMHKETFFMFDKVSTDKQVSEIRKIWKIVVIILNVGQKTAKYFFSNRYVLATQDVIFFPW